MHTRRLHWDVGCLISYFDEGLVTTFPRNRFFAILFLFLCVVAASAAFAQVPNPPAGSTVIDRLEESTDWETCGSCGNSGGAGEEAFYSIERGINSPALDGSSTQFKIGGSHPYKNAYWYIKHYGTPSKPLSYLKYEFELYIPSAYAHAPQAIEFECQQKAGGHIYNFAWQADYAHQQWRIFNYASRVWESSGLSFAGFTPGTWHHVIAEFHATGTEVVHDALTIDGVRRIVNIHHAAKAGSTGEYLTNAFQLDLNGSPTPYQVYVDAMSITYK